MWLVDSPVEKYGVTLRDGGAHKIFGTTSQEGAPDTRVDKDGNQNNSYTNNDTTITQSHGGPHAALRPGPNSPSHQEDGPIREMLVAGGTDLQERKRLLVDKADGLIVLPGGPGTWDELWEMACARNIGLTTLPIVCVNVNGYYDPFAVMLERAWNDQLTKLEPQDIVHFEETAEAAVKWIEQVQDRKNQPAKVQLRKRTSTLRKSSFMSVPVVNGEGDDWFFGKIRRSLAKAVSLITSETESDHDTSLELGKRQRAIALSVSQVLLFFSGGVVTGLLLARQRARAS